MISNKTIPNNLHHHRIQSGLRQIDVAHALGLESSDRISLWEKRTAVPHLVNLFKLARLYRTQIEKLYAEVFEEAVIGIRKTPENE